jgi:chromosome segregation ATPase
VQQELSNQITINGNLKREVLQKDKELSCLNIKYRDSKLSLENAEAYADLQVEEVHKLRGDAEIYQQQLRDNAIRLSDQLDEIIALDVEIVELKLQNDRAIQSFLSSSIANSDLAKDLLEIRNILKKKEEQLKETETFRNELQSHLEKYKRWYEMQKEGIEKQMIFIQGLQEKIKKLRTQKNDAIKESRNRWNFLVKKKLTREYSGTKSK